MTRLFRGTLPSRLIPRRTTTITSAQSLATCIEAALASKPLLWDSRCLGMYSNCIPFPNLLYARKRDIEMK